MSPHILGLLLGHGRHLRPRLAVACRAPSTPPASVSPAPSSSAAPTYRPPPPCSPQTRVTGWRLLSLPLHSYLPAPSACEKTLSPQRWRASLMAVISINQTPTSRLRTSHVRTSNASSSRRAPTSHRVHRPRRACQRRGRECRLSRLKTGRPNSAEEAFTSRQIAVSARRKTGFGSRRSATGKIPKRRMHPPACRKMTRTTRLSFWELIPSPLTPFVVRYAPRARSMCSARALIYRPFLTRGPMALKPPPTSWRKLFGRLLVTGFCTSPY
ncbi:hypothetical protein B0H14DRAFT_3156125, partial [Mycena olivaceomarginata]